MKQPIGAGLYEHCSRFDASGLRPTTTYFWLDFANSSSSSSADFHFQKAVFLCIFYVLSLSVRFLSLLPLCNVSLEYAGCGPGEAEAG